MCPCPGYGLRIVKTTKYFRGNTLYSNLATALLQVLTDTIWIESWKLRLKMSLKYLLMETLQAVLIVSVGGHWAWCDMGWWSPWGNLLWHHIMTGSRTSFIPPLSDLINTIIDGTLAPDSCQLKPDCLLRWPLSDLTSVKHQQIKIFKILRSRRFHLEESREIGKWSKPSSSYHHQPDFVNASVIITFPLWIGHG